MFLGVHRGPASDTSRPARAGEGAHETGTLLSNGTLPDGVTAAPCG